MEGQAKKFKIMYMLFGLLGTGLIVATYFLPVWWVALQSIQYPKAMYPKGIRIEFKYDGVYNGCKGVREREELAVEAGANCLIEMNKINHFIGMYPIVQGVNDSILLTTNKIEFEDKPTLLKTLNLNKNILQKENDSTLLVTNPDITKLRVPYPVYANDSMPDKEIPKQLKVLDKIMHSAKLAFGILGLLGLIFVFVDKKKLSFAAIITALAPIYFLAIYIFYLYWYGHNLGLHGGGAFNGIKPFMPTVFGEGKVAQFTTMSYPYIGFFVGLAGMVLLFLAIGFKGKYLKLKK